MSENTSQPVNSLPRRSVLLTFFRAFRMAVNSPCNRLFVAQPLERDTTYEERLVHFVKYGGQADLRRRFLTKYPGAASFIN